MSKIFCDLMRFIILKVSYIFNVWTFWFFMIDIIGLRRRVGYWTEIGYGYDEAVEVFVMALEGSCEKSIIVIIQRVLLIRMVVYLGTVENWKGLDLFCINFILRRVPMP